MTFLCTVYNACSLGPSLKINRIKLKFLTRQQKFFCFFKIKKKNSLEML